MKPRPHRNTPWDKDPDRLWDRSPSERGITAEIRGIPPRRYPSLSDDFQPFFRRSPRTPPSVTSVAIATRAARESMPSPLSHARVFIFLAIVAIVAALVAAASV